MWGRVSVKGGEFDTFWDSGSYVRLRVGVSYTGK